MKTNTQKKNAKKTISDETFAQLELSLKQAVSKKDYVLPKKLLPFKVKSPNSVFIGKQVAWLAPLFNLVLSKKLPIDATHWRVPTTSLN